MAEIATANIANSFVIFDFMLCWFTSFCVVYIAKIHRLADMPKGVSLLCAGRFPIPW